MTVDRVISTETEDFKDPSVNPRPSSKAAWERAEVVSGRRGGSHLVLHCWLSPIAEGLPWWKIRRQPENGMSTGSRAQNRFLIPMRRCWKHMHEAPRRQMQLLGEFRYECSRAEYSRALLNGSGKKSCSVRPCEAWNLQQKSNPFHF